MDHDRTELSNEPIDVAGLPRLRPDPYVSVDPRHALGSVAAQVVIGVAVAIGGTVITAQSDATLWRWIGLGVGCLSLVSAAWSWAAARRVAYQVRDHDVSLRSGIVALTEESVPFRRVQHVQLSRGLLDRSLGLASLSVNSAGPDISIPGLPVDTATTLRAWMVDRAGLDAEAGDADAAGESTEGRQSSAPLPPPTSPTPVAPQPPPETPDP